MRLPFFPIPTIDKNIRPLIALHHFSYSIPAEATLKKFCIPNCETLHYVTAFFTLLLSSYLFPVLYNVVDCPAPCQYTLGFHHKILLAFLFTHSFQFV
jgi:hypothetical protein